MDEKLQKPNRTREIFGIIIARGQLQFTDNVTEKIDTK